MNNFMNKILLLLVAFLVLSSVANVRAEDKEKNKGVEKISNNDVQDEIAINQIRMMFYNNGIGSYNRTGGSSGLYWPGGVNAVQTAIFEDGLLIGAKVGTEIRVGGSAYRTGLQAGKILPSGRADAVNDPKYRIWKIRKGWEKLDPGPLRTRLEYDYNNWPVEDGAPWVDVDSNKVFDRNIDKPSFIGDEVDWFVCNDLDASRTTFLYGTQPMGLEIQNTIFAFKKDGPLGDMLFKKYTIINKGTKNLKDVYLCQWSDPDLGNAGDDYVGCDTLLKIGYVYNGDADDEGANGYGKKPPAAAYVFFQGPTIPYDPVAYPIITAKGLPDSAKFNWKWLKNKTNVPMTSFSFFINGSSIYADPVQGKPEGSVQFYNYMTSKLWDGKPFVDPTTTPPTNALYCLAGDPVKGTGWYEGKGWPGGQAPGDRRIVLSAGPFNMNPGDTQEVVIGIVLAQGTDNLNSVKVLKDVVGSAQAAYDINFELIPNITSPKLNAVLEDKKIILYWDRDSTVEDYAKIDRLIIGDNTVDKTFRFEGFELYQYKDIKGTNPQLIATYDLANDIGEVWDEVKINGYKVTYPVVFGTNSGIKRLLEVTTDKVSGRALHNGSPYYFGLVAYGYNKNAAIKIMKSVPDIMEFVPQTAAVGDQYVYKYGSAFEVTKSESNDGIVNTFVLDPNRLTGDRYEVNFTGSSDTAYRWSLKNITKNIDVLKNIPCDTITTEADRLKDAILVDGFLIKVFNPGLQYRKVKEIILTKDGGNPVNPVGNVFTGVPREGQNVFGAASKTATRKWWIDVWDSTFAPEGYTYASGGVQALNYLHSQPKSDYEIRFSPNDSTPYYPYRINGLLANGQVTAKTTYIGKNKIPFSVYQLNNPGDATDDKRMYLKSYDGKLIGYIYVNGKFAGANSYLDTLWGGGWYDEIRLAHEKYAYEEVVAFHPLNNAAYTEPLNPVLPVMKGTDFKLRFTIFGDTPEDFPKPNSVVKVSQWKGVAPTAKFTFTATKPIKNDKSVAKNNIDDISVFPNPYYGAHALEVDKYQRFVRFTNLPSICTIRIYSLAGVLVRRLDHPGLGTSSNPAFANYEDWDLLNKDGVPVASGMFIAHVEIPGVGSKILKLAIIQESPYIDRL